MKQDVAILVSSMRLNPAATDDAIQEAESLLGVRLPEEYLAFMREANGGVGMIGKHYLDLFPIEELVSSNTNLNTAEYAPGKVVFGSNGSLAAYAFDTHSSHVPIVEVDFLTLDYVKEVAKTFATFLEKLNGKI
jgi:hypothetical protein